MVQGYADFVHHHHGGGGGRVGVQGVGGVGVQPCAQKYLSVEVTKTLSRNVFQNKDLQVSRPLKP